MELPIQEFEEKNLRERWFGCYGGNHGLQSVPETVLETKKVLTLIQPPREDPYSHDLLGGSFKGCLELNE